MGFRPFVYRLARELGLSGWVLNDSRGVFVEVEGSRSTLAGLADRIRADAPARAIVHRLVEAWLPAAGATGFRILESAGVGRKTAVVLPDIATCNACLTEILDPTDRRHGYPFTNCTDCGPRFSIIQRLPYDRPNTTMSRFVMCDRCEREYRERRSAASTPSPTPAPSAVRQLERCEDRCAVARTADRRRSVVELTVERARRPAKMRRGQRASAAST